VASEWLLTNPQAGLAIFLAVSALSGILLGRIFRPWLLGGIIAGPAASILAFAIERLLRGYLDPFWPIAFVVAFGFSFVVTIPCSFIGFLWRRQAAAALERRKAHPM
jgi:hypothetical protein